MSKSNKEQIKKMIRRIAKEYGVNEELALKVCECESGFNPKAVNVNLNGSWDRGLYQWNNKWHPEIADDCAFNPECATEHFCIAVKHNHLSWWNATRSCWESALKKSLLIKIRDLLKKLTELYKKLIAKLRGF